MCAYLAAVAVPSLRLCPIGDIFDGHMMAGHVCIGFNNDGSVYIMGNTLDPFCTGCVGSVNLNTQSACESKNMTWHHTSCSEVADDTPSDHCQTLKTVLQTVGDSTCCHAQSSFSPSPEPTASPEPAASPGPYVCELSQLMTIMSHISATCLTSLINALSTDKSPGDTERAECSCFLEVPEATASALTCKARADDDETLYEQYKDCMRHVEPSPDPSAAPEPAASPAPHVGCGTQE